MYRNGGVQPAEKQLPPTLCTAQRFGNDLFYNAICVQIQMCIRDRFSWIGHSVLVSRQVPTCTPHAPNASAAAVSYTHLDVYKRQAIRSTWQSKGFCRWCAPET